MESRTRNGDLRGRKAKIRRRRNEGQHARGIKTQKKKDGLHEIRRTSDGMLARFVVGLSVRASAHERKGEKVGGGCLCRTRETNDGTLARFVVKRSGGTNERGKMGHGCLPLTGLGQRTITRESKAKIETNILRVGRTEEEKMRGRPNTNVVLPTTDPRGDDSEEERYPK